MVVKLCKMLIKPALPNHRPKKISLGTECITNKAPNLHSVNCSEMNTALVTNKRLL